MKKKKKIIKLSDGKKKKDNEKIIYVDGEFDMFNVGNLDLIEKEREEGE